MASNKLLTPCSSPVTQRYFASMIEGFEHIYGPEYPSSRPLFTTSPSAFFCAVFLLFLTHCVVAYAKARTAWKTLPTLVFPLSPISVLSNFMPRSKWNPGTQFTWEERNQLYKTAGSEIVAVAGFIRGKPTLYASSPEVIRQILGNKAPFTKPTRAKSPVGFMGANVIASDGDMWKAHRKIASPAFSHEGYKQVWAETMRTYFELSATEGWNEQDTIVLSNVYRITKKLALFIISSCGFNISLTWADGDVTSDGQMSLQAVISNVSNSILIRWLTPKWLYYLPSKRLQRVDKAYNRLESFLRSQISIRRKEIQEEFDLGGDPLEVKREIFTRLIVASASEGSLGLNDEEIIGNTFIMLFAGHETTAHTLAATLVLLGLYEEEQARVHKRIIDVLGDRVPTFEDHDALEAVILPVAYEAMRLYPPAFLMMRKAGKDTSLSIPRMDGSGQTELPIPKGTEIMLDVIGAGYNQRWFPDANSFNPSRWDGRLDASLAFSHGPRTCLGRKFATTEMVCFLSLMLRDWEIQVSRDGNVSREQWREKYMRPTLYVAMNMPPLPVKLVRRI